MQIAQNQPQSKEVISPTNRNWLIWFIVPGVIIIATFFYKKICHFHEKKILSQGKLPRLFFFIMSTVKNSFYQKKTPDFYQKKI